jgi:hypothetical protein
LVATLRLIWFLGSSGEERWSDFARFFPRFPPLFLWGGAGLDDLLESVQLSCYSCLQFLEFSS